MYVDQKPKEDFAFSNAFYNTFITDHRGIILDIALNIF